MRGSSKGKGQRAKILGGEVLSVEASLSRHELFRVQSFEFKDFGRL